MSYLSKVMLIIIVFLGLWLSWLMDHNKKINLEYINIENELSKQILINKDYQLRVNQLNQIDIRHQKELSNAKNEIDKLRDITERTPERVYIRAECPKSPFSATPRMDDANTARPTDTAIRNYWLLRERMARSKQIILGLQEYIRIECMP